MPESIVHGWQTLANDIAQMKCLCNLQVTFHGLDTGICRFDGIFGSVGLGYSAERRSVGTMKNIIKRF